MPAPVVPADLPTACDGTTLRPDALPAPAFQRAVLAHLVTVPELTAASRGPFRLRVGYGGQDFEVRLDESFKRYRHGECSTLDVADEVQAALGIPGTTRQAAGPYPRLARLTDVPPGAFHVACPFDPELAVFFVRTLPSGHVALRTAEVADGPALVERALANLRALTLTTPGDAEGEGAALVLRFEVGDGLDAARLLLPDLLATMAEWLEGRLLAAVPCRDALLVLADADAARLASVRSEVAARYTTDPYPVSDRWYTLSASDAGPAVRLLDAAAADR